MYSQTKIQLPYNKLSWKEGNPFTMAFVRSRDEGNHVVTGGLLEIEEYLKYNFLPCLVSFAYWHKGKSRFTHVKLLGYNTIGFFRIFDRYKKEYPNKRYMLYHDHYKILETYRHIPNSFPTILRVNNSIIVP